MTTVEDPRLRAMTEPAHNGAIAGALANLDRLDRALPDLFDLADGRLDDLLTMLADADELVAKAREIRGAIEQRCAQGMERNKYESWAAGILAIRNQAYDDDWNHRGTARAVAEAAVVNRQTGEVLTDPDQVRDAVVDGLLAALGANPSWKTTALKQIDIDPEQFRTRAKKRRTVRVIRNGGAP